MDEGNHHIDSQNASKWWSVQQWRNEQSSLEHAEFRMVYYNMSYSFTTRWGPLVLSWFSSIVTPLTIVIIYHYQKPSKPT